MIPLLFWLLPSFVSANPFPRASLVEHESLVSVPDGFIHSGAATEDQSLDLRLSLAQNDIAGLRRVLMEVSTPGNAKYGKHLSKQEVVEYVKPKQDSIDAINAFLASHSINASTNSPAGDWVGFTTSVSKASEMFGTRFATFNHTRTEQQTIRTLSYSIPQALKDHLDFVHPTIMFPDFISNSGLEKKSFSPRADVPNSCSSQITPACIQALYNLPSTLATQTSNRLGVTGLGEQYAQKADLKAFLTKYRTDIPSNTSFDLMSVNGGKDPQNPHWALTSKEANIDMEYTVGIAAGVPAVFISVGPGNTDGLNGMLDLANALLNQDNPPQVVTTSYGTNEQKIPQNLAVKLCDVFAQLGARGVSVLYSSGDGGVSGNTNSDCTQFVASFPSSCPYVTSVGGTSGIPENTAYSSSSGGFSNYFTTPDYQASAVSNYIKNLNTTYQGLYNASGRAFPDVAAQANDLPLISGSREWNSEGTSYASPIFASVVALLNDQLIAAGKSPLGFLNPFLYSTGASALNDITSGSNPGCKTNGFSAGNGWDPVTGLGTPNFSALKQAVGL